MLRLDFVGLTPAEMADALRKASEIITTEPPASLRVLTHLDSQFNACVAETLKSHAVTNRPYLRASAVVATGFWHVVVTSIKLHGRRDLALFDSDAPALDWLTRSCNRPRRCDGECARLLVTRAPLVEGAHRGHRPERAPARPGRVRLPGWWEGER